MSFLLRLCLGILLLMPVLAQAARLEIPGQGANLSGIGVISGWKCEVTGTITVRIDGGNPIPMLYGSERGDTRSVCGDSANGFVAIFNWGLLDDGTHTAVATDGADEFARSTFTVTTFGEEFVQGASGECRIPDFPAPGRARPMLYGSERGGGAPTIGSSRPGKPPGGRGRSSRRLYCLAQQPACELDWRLRRAALRQQHG